MKEVEAVAREQEQLAATFQERLEAETRKQVNQVRAGGRPLQANFVGILTHI